jgi:hypothetical protein
MFPKTFHPERWSIAKETLEVTLYSRPLAFSACSFDSSEGDVNTNAGL